MKSTKELVEKDSLVALIRELAGAYGASGDEAHVRELILGHIKDHVDDLHTDKMGNLICHQRGEGPKVMLAAHMDEIGLMVEEITERGFIKLALVGGVAPETLLAQQVHISGSKGMVHGVISHKNLHEDYEMDNFPPTEELYVDVGLNSDKEVRKIGIEIGNYIIPRRAFAVLGSKDIISGKALDDRVGCAMLIDLAKRTKKLNKDIYYVFTVQEEVGLYGAKTSLYDINPDIGIAVDTTNADDYEADRKGLGKGPCITVKDSELIADRCLVDWIKKIGKKKHIPYQLEVTDVGTTDALAMSLSKGGLPTTAISVPVRNIHSTISIAHMNDIRNCIKLLYELLVDPPLICIKG